MQIGEGGRRTGLGGREKRGGEIERGKARREGGIFSLEYVVTASLLTYRVSK